MYIAKNFNEWKSLLYNFRSRFIQRISEISGIDLDIN